MILVEPLARPQVPAPTKIKAPWPPRFAFAMRSCRVFAQVSSLWQMGPSARQRIKSRHGLPGRWVQRSQQAAIRLLACIALPTRGLVEQAVELFHVEMAVEFAIQLDDRRDGAGPEASHRDDGELVVRRVAVGFETQPSRQVLRQLQALLHVAGGAPAPAARALPLEQAEERQEPGDAPAQ